MAKSVSVRTNDGLGYTWVFPDPATAGAAVAGLIEVLLRRSDAEPNRYARHELTITHYEFNTES